MVWAIDQKDQSASNNVASGVSKDQQDSANQASADQAAKLSCYTTDCDASCKKGTNQVTQMNGQPGQLSTRSVHITQGLTKGVVHLPVLRARLCCPIALYHPPAHKRNVLCLGGTTFLPTLAMPL
jgi:hypothetical protein